MSKVSKKQWVIKKSLFEFLVKVLFTLMYLPSSVETLVSFCMTGLCALVLGISSLLGRRKKGSGRGREKSTKSPSLFPFLPIPYPFRRLLRRLGISCFVNIVDRTFACQPSHSAKWWSWCHARHVIRCVHSQEVFVSRVNGNACPCIYYISCWLLQQSFVWAAQQPVSQIAESFERLSQASL